jgi:WD40 repeat protein
VAGGKRIAFTRTNLSVCCALTIMHSDGSDKKTVAPQAERAALSPSGTKVAELSGDLERLVLKTPAGKPLRSFRLPSGAVALDFPPVWAPAEQAIALATDAGIAVSERTGVRLIHSSQGQPNGFALAWSPDLRSIAFLRYRGSPVDLLLIRRDGTHLRTVSRGTTSAGSWSPNGQRLAFARKDGIYVVRPDGSGRRRITAESARQIVWSPDSKRLAYLGAGISVISVHGGPTRRITIVSKGDQEGLSWAPAERIVWSRKQIIWTGLPGSQPVAIG